MRRNSIILARAARLNMEPKIECLARAFTAGVMTPLLPKTK